jgi:hypothetical protein
MGLEIHFDSPEAMEKIRRTLAGALGGDAGVSVETVTAMTLVLAVPLLFARPQGWLPKLRNRAQRQRFLGLLKQLRRQMQLELILTTPDGRRVDLCAIDADDWDDLFPSA